MSLTSYLKGKETRISRFFAEKFPTVQPLSKDANTRLKRATTVRPTDRLPYSTIGMALDYRLRYYFACTPSKELVAWEGAYQLGYTPRTDGTRYIPDTDAISVTVIEAFFKDLEAELGRLRPWKDRLEKSSEDLICRYCVVLAYFEELYRSPATKNSPLLTKIYHSVEDLLALSEPHWIEDLRSLSWLFHDRYDDLILNSEPPVLNPTFEGSLDIGGADGDLIVDHCLIDIKTTVNPQIQRQWIYQIVGYVLLDYSNQYDLKSVGLYMARQGQLLTWPIPELLSVLTGSNTVSFEELRTEFKNLLGSMRTEREIVSAKWREQREQRYAQSKLKYARGVVRRYRDTDPDSLPKRQKNSLIRALGLLAQ